MTRLVLPRRKFLTGLGALFAAPAIVRASSLMPIHALPFEKPTVLILSPSEMYAELSRLRRRTLIPRFYTQIYASTPLSELLR